MDGFQPRFKLACDKGLEFVGAELFTYKDFPWPLLD